MSLHSRKWIAVSLCGMCSCGAAWALLALLHAHLGAASVVRFDRGVQLWVHGWQRPWLTGLMLAFTWMGAVKIFLSALALVIAGLMMRGDRRAAGMLGFTMSAALLLNEALKMHFHRARPVVAWSIGDEHTFSFPSGHSFFSVVLYGTLAYLALKGGAPWVRWVSVIVPSVLLPLGIGLSRIYLGMHFPTDVVAGYILGLVVVTTGVAVDRLWGLKHRSEA